ncbi:Hypothetical protein ORPV_175 [Orpheovirus IHUMI-LCC2]|uniref:Uncharacterized protein n=1 Tax=Orpheovirus IHUMI-LCC2 TaxID=2023057 RepID=A0A2I2L3M8_9VIRU|nr:Hypothetical protein ORPV_175 [Orpheovirus IHUMI-LCC2]SNW62079.1 Hypothetical protein ORPV_175 [Orpheovirus IHUMI-LCC2]
MSEEVGFWVDTILQNYSKGNADLINKMGKNKEYCVTILSYKDLKSLGLLDDSEYNHLYNSDDYNLYNSLLYTPKYVAIQDGYQMRVSSMSWYTSKDDLSFKIMGNAYLSDAMPQYSIRFDLIKVSNSLCTIM